MIDELALVLCQGIDLGSACETPCHVCTRQAEAAVDFIRNYPVALPGSSLWLDTYLQKKIHNNDTQ